MHFNVGLKTVFFVVVVIAVISDQQSEAAPKLELLKAKLALKKIPHIAASVAVAKEVKTKAKIAALKTIDAIKASKIAALSLITAPFRKIKKGFVYKIIDLKALKALKAAKLAAGLKIAKNLKKSPIILPVPVAVPVKDLKSVGLKAGLGAGIGASLGAGLAAPAAAAASIGTALPSLGAIATSALNPFPGIISGATKAIQNVGASIPFLSTLTGDSARVADEITSASAPTYQFVPEIGFSNYNKVSYQPHVEVEVPSAVAYPEPVYQP